MKIKVQKNKTLKLINTLTVDICTHELEALFLKVQQMENYIKVNGRKTIGPIVQYTRIGEENLETKIILQIDKNIEKLDSIYKYKEVLKVNNCLYCRYNGTNDKLDMAYSKLKVVAFEEDINLTGVVYTVYLNEDEENTVVDIFMECENSDDTDKIS